MSSDWDDEYDYHYEGVSIGDHPADSRTLFVSPTCTEHVGDEKQDARSSCDEIRTMDTEGILLEMSDRIHAVSDILTTVPLEAIPLLLWTCRWSAELLLERYMEDSKRLLQEAGVYHRCFTGQADNAETRPMCDPASVVHCSICYENCMIQDMYEMPCRHAYCKGCWTDYLHNALDQVGSACAYQTTCPHARCPEKITQLEYLMVFGGKTSPHQSEVPGQYPEPRLKQHPDLKRFSRFTVMEYVTSNPLAQYCPGPDCDRVASAWSYHALHQAGGLATCHTCKPSLTFCVGCGHHEAHAPASCSDVRLCDSDEFLQSILKYFELHSVGDFKIPTWFLVEARPCKECSHLFHAGDGTYVVPCFKK
jgi:ariadne-1